MLALAWVCPTVRTVTNGGPPVLPLAAPTSDVNGAHLSATAVLNKSHVVKKSNWLETLDLGDGPKIGPGAQPEVLNTIHTNRSPKALSLPAELGSF